MAGGLSRNQIPHLFVLAALLAGCATARPDTRWSATLDAQAYGTHDHLRLDRLAPVGHVRLALRAASDQQVMAGATDIVLGPGSGFPLVRIGLAAAACPGQCVAEVEVSVNGQRSQLYHFPQPAPQRGELELVVNWDGRGGVQLLVAGQQVLAVQDIPKFREVEVWARGGEVRVEQLDYGSGPYVAGSRT